MLEGAARQVYLYSTFHTPCKFKVLYIKGSQAGGLTSERPAGMNERLPVNLTDEWPAGLG